MKLKLQVFWDSFSVFGFSHREFRKALLKLALDVILKFNFLTIEEQNGFKV